ncbi:MAG: hypothetical protein Q7U78_11335 [Gallionella sp.]|nr:hypothetical protein [Gallionella sp.]
MLDNPILRSVRDELLSEAKLSPGLLADLANLERYVAETYSARSFIELLQNADDAGAKRFLVMQDGDRLICANDGRPFSRNDFYSLCRSASSDKKRGQSIGYRGIGFKSVVGMVSEVHLLSESLEATFSRQLSHESLGMDVQTPLVRIPHPLAMPSDKPLAAKLAEIRAAGFSTIFIFGGIDRAKVEEEFVLFDAEYLLFLRNITEATLTGAKERRYSCSREALHDHCRGVQIVSDDRRSDWQIHSFARCDIAFSLLDGSPVPLNPSSALVHAFLPTLEQTGLGIRINADFSTDPSRTRIVFDDFTGECVASAADAVANLFREAIQKNPIDSALESYARSVHDLSEVDDCPAANPSNQIGELCGKKLQNKRKEISSSELIYKLLIGVTSRLPKLCCVWCNPCPVRRPSRSSCGWRRWAMSGCRKWPTPPVRWIAPAKPGKSTDVARSGYSSV